MGIKDFREEDAKEVPMEKFKCYNVLRGVWHTIATSRDAHVFIVENADTSDDNSEFLHKEVKVVL